MFLLHLKFDLYILTQVYSNENIFPCPGLLTLYKEENPQPVKFALKRLETGNVIERNKAPSPLVVNSNTLLFLSKGISLSNSIAFNFEQVRKNRDRRIIFCISLDI